ncbi:hypothetical protein MTO98_15930 [Mucilaginibacter sp. SMC90]|uniref:hypothetical protein n=1 Tax=Mucilaginibacter sp. SMC90 TaxID=2929803 RepID=UPI001FB52288|nr:hypothetical protein [Mucilaginibacter sp. SMC90]UOE52566.1 hypothetical protein MTO98_15930 [Mucilaginibacter sp. SMC90]
MKNISVRLQQFVTESLHPKAIVGQRFTFNEFEKWKQFITKETNALYLSSSKIQFTNRKRKEAYIIDILNELISISNTVNGYLFKQSRIWKNMPEASEIRQGYVFTCLAFENLIDKLVIKYPEIAENTRLSDYTIRSVRIDLKLLLTATQKHLVGHFIEQDILAVLFEGISDLINLQPLDQAHVSYLRKLMSSITARRFESAKVLMDYLIINDFNVPSFFLFCVNNWSDQLSDLDGLLEQREMILETKSHLFDLTLTKGLKFPFAKQRFYNELNNYLSEKYSLVKERLKIRTQFVAAENARPRAKRVLINLSVAQLGLFIRLQVEKGILAKEHIGELFAFFAKHFYTPNTDIISADSLQKKSSDVEHATAVKLKGHLIAMLNWLNTHYNLSNFN